MAFFDRLLSLVRPQPAARNAQLRRFDAAVVNRLTESWVASQASIDQELRNDLDRLRRRSRDLAKNNEYLAKFLRMVRNNVIGQGMALQSRPFDGKKLDGLAAQTIERHFAQWSKPTNCDVTGRMGFWSMMRAASDALARDGEVLIRVRSDRSAYCMRLQLLDVERLNTKMNRARTPGSNAIIMGVEVDDFRCPVAYHIHTVLPGDTGATETRVECERVPADQIIHRFLMLEPEQTRGVPWAHAAMRRLNDLGGYREAAVIAARIGASKMGFFTSPEPETLQDGTDDNGVPYTSAAPGEFGVLPPGVGFQTFDPAYPHEQFGEFVKAALRGIASGLGVSYNSLANDLEGVNFSSIRSGVLEERDEWMVLQDWWIEQIIDPIFDRWLKTSLSFGTLTQVGDKGTSALPVLKLEKFSEHLWMPRRWGWVDPLKDVQATVLAISNNLTTTTDAAARNGVDIEDVFATKQREKELAAQYSIDLTPQPAKPARPKAGAATDPAARSLPNEPGELTDMLKLARRNQAAGGAVEWGLRMEPPPIPAPAPIINVAAPTVNVAAPDVTIVNQVQPAEVAAPDVYVEAVMPAPSVAVNVQVPPRRVDTSIQRDSTGRIVSSTQIETDV